MKKSLIVLFVLVAVLFSSCQLMDSLFFKADAVKASQLEDFDGDAAATEEEAMMGAMMGVSGAMSVLASATPPTPEAANIIAKFTPALAKLQAKYGKNPVTAALATKFPASSKEYTFTVGGDEDTLEYDLSFTDEDLDAEGLTLNGSASAKVSGIPTEESSYPIEVKASGKADLKMEIAAIDETPFNGAIANLNAKGNGEFNMASETADPSVKVYVAIAMNAGFSLDSTDETPGGKYIVTFKFIDTVDEDVDPEDPTSVTENLDLEIVVKVYDNADDLVESYTFTEEDIETEVPAAE